MKKVTKKLTALLCAASLVLGICGGSVYADAAKKPKLSASKITLNAGQTKTVKVKNSVKAAKVTWKINKTKIAKITKKTSGKNASAKIKGVSAGTAKLSAVYKLGKKKTALKCTVVVNGAATNNDTAATQVPATNNNVVSQPTAAPTAEAPAPTAEPTPEPTPEPVYKWLTTWGTSEEKNDISADSAMPKRALADSTIRQIIRVTTGGGKIKFRLSNQYGGSDVKVGSMHIAIQVEADKSTIDPDTDTVVTVDGEESFTIPKGKVIETDGIDFEVHALENVAISMYFDEAPTSNITGHRGARATTYQVAGDACSEETLTGYQTTTSWFFLADVSLWTPEEGRAVVCFGDSITDGYGTDASYLGRKPDSYTRWGDYFAKRLQENESTKYVSVINEGIGANGMMGSYPTDSGRNRFARDLLEHDGVAYCIILFGVNDLNNLNNTNAYNQLQPEFKKMVDLCHENGIKCYGAPILPFGTSSYYSVSSEKVRTMLNDWMRSDESEMDAIIPFDEAVADPADPTRILEAYTHSDGLHPYDGYDVMADAIDLTLFELEE